QSPLILTLPLPDGSFAHFQVVESSVLAPALAAKNPDIRTYVAQGVDDPFATARLDRTSEGFHGMILSPRGCIFIDPYARGDPENYLSFDRRAVRRDKGAWVCHTLPGVPLNGGHPGGITPLGTGALLQTYRLAISCTGEYYTARGGTTTAVKSAI